MYCLTQILWLTFSTISCILFTNLISLVIFASGLIILITLREKCIYPSLIAIKLTLPFLIPLFIVHGFLNPQFAGFRFNEYLYIKFDGCLYALITSLRIFILTLAISHFRILQTHEFIYDANKFKIHQNTILVVLIAISTINFIIQKANSIYISQQARGIPSGPNILNRLMFLPSLILPLITSVLLEGAWRGNLIKIRGMESTDWSLLDTEIINPKIELRPFIIIIIFLLGCYIQWKIK